MYNTSYRNRLAKPQRCDVVGITGAILSTLQAALEIILYILPIENYITDARYSDPNNITILEFLVNLVFTIYTYIISKIR